MNSSLLHLRLVVLLVALLASSSTVFSQSGGPYEMKRSVVAGGGSKSFGLGVTVVGTVGQAAAGAEMVMVNSRQIGGFWPGAASNAPTDLILSGTEVPEHSPFGTFVGQFKTQDADESDIFTYMLVNGPGSTDNGAFTISNDVLKTGTANAVRGTYSIRVRVTDADGHSIEKQFSINVVPTEGGGIIQFSSPTYSVLEGAGLAPITIMRNGGSGTIQLTFSTSNGTASPSDYTSVSQTVVFTAGETSKVVNVPITNDSINEPDETVNLSITEITDSPSSGNTPSVIANALLTIIDDDPLGGVISFSQANYSVPETGPGFIDITVTRTGDLSRAVTVDYATPDDSDSLVAVPCAVTNGLASSRCDFTTALGTLRFAPGESSKTFTVLISQDSYVEGPETLILTLSNPTGGAAFGQRSTAALMIVDDLMEPADNPIDDPSNFVRQHYHDFLNREPDPSGLAWWTNQITECGSNVQCIQRKRIHVSAAFFLSIEFQQTGYRVERLYKTAYGDLLGNSRLEGGRQVAAPIVRVDEFLLDTQRVGRNVVVGQDGWEALLETNTKAYAEEFVQRARFLAEFPLSMGDGDFIDKLNANTGNCLTQRQRDALVEDLGTHFKTRAQVVREIADNQQLQKAEFNKAFVLMQYFGYLRRHPNSAPDFDHTGFDFWLTKMNQFNGNFVEAEMVNSFLISLEYRRRFDQ